MKEMAIQDLHMQQPKALSYKGIYSMHKYWSKKPFNIIRYFIEKYSNEGDIVLDPFCGSGISNIESVLSGRKTIGIDINPAATFITEQVLTKIEQSALKSEFQNIKDDCLERINSLYAVKRGKNQFTATHFLYTDGVPTEVWYRGKGGEKMIETPTRSDLDLIKSFSYDTIKEFFPTTSMIPNQRINVKEGMHVYDLFTPRNLQALAILLQRINKIQDRKTREMFRFCFTACVGQASRMVFVINRRGRTKDHTERLNKRKEIGSWVIGYWIPKENFEVNVWNCFKNRFSRIVKAKKEQYYQEFEVKKCQNFSQLGDSNLVLVNSNCHDIMKKMSKNSIDYVITDPPHGDRQPYLELSMMWNGWLGFEADLEHELVVSNAKTRNKDVENYNKSLTEIIKQIERVLKPGKYFTLMFNSLDDHTWNNLQKTLYNLNMDLVDIATVDYSATSVVQDNRDVGLKTDFAFTFKKQHGVGRREYSQLDSDKLEERTKYLVRNFCKQGNPRPYEILNHTVTSLMSDRIMFDLTMMLELLRRETRNAC